MANARRQKYGPSGHGGSYSRAAPDCRRMVLLIVRLMREGVLSEGQAARATGLGRVQLRKIAQGAKP